MLRARSALASLSISSGRCSDERATRRREVPEGTVGGLIALTKSPLLSSSALASSAICSDPMISGTIGLCTCTPVASLKVSKLLHSLARLSGVARRSAALAAATIGMGSAVEKMPDL